MSATFGDLERAVMEVLWTARDADPDRAVTGREVHDALASRDLAYTTVMTVLDRLVAKESVERIQRGRVRTYRATSSRAEMTADLMHETLADFTGTDRGRALVAFVDDASAEDIEAIRAALDRLD